MSEYLQCKMHRSNSTQTTQLQTSSLDVNRF
jgi:hypothetical protein